MPVATARTISLQGGTGHLIDVQADVSQGQVGTTVVGRADVALHEGRDRCRMAIVNSRLDWPNTRRVTILLSPADLAKRGTHFDLAVALAVLGATGAVPKAGLAETVFIGELTLEGGLRPVPGVLPMVLAAATAGFRTVVVPEPQTAEAALVPDVTVLGFRSLAQVVAELCGEEVPEAPPVAASSGNPLLAWRGEERMEEVDFADLLGLADARFAVEVAAAGGHHLLLSGPKGSGKTTLAERIPGILPDLTPQEALELAALQSLSGTLDPAARLLRPPYAAPHHDASKASILGGGTGRVRPGALSLAHCGVLLLDEFPLFRTDVIDGLREPMESGDVNVARGEETATYPARPMVVMACNPCPCGDYHPDARLSQCTCGELKRRDYRARVSGPIVDRIDITRHLVPLQPHDAHDRFAVPETTATVRARVEQARARQERRYLDRSWRLNAHAPAPALRADWPLPPEGQRLVDDQVYGGRLSRRGATRVHRLAWTVADLAGLDGPDAACVDTALRLRAGEPLLLTALRVAG